MFAVVVDAEKRMRWDKQIDQTCSNFQLPSWNRRISHREEIVYQSRSALDDPVNLMTFNPNTTYLVNQTFNTNSAVEIQKWQTQEIARKCEKRSYSSRYCSGKLSRLDQQTPSWFAPVTNLKHDLSNPPSLPSHAHDPRTNRMRGPELD